MTNAEFERKAQELRQQGINLPGPIGKVSSSGVTAAYTHANETLTVHIVDKPAFISRVYCERRLEDWLKV